MKALLKDMDLPTAAVNRIYHYVEKELKKLHNQGILILPPHKKKAILSTVAKLPSATGRSHSIANVRKGFILNGQIDMDSKLVPSFSNILYTFRGDICNTCLENQEALLSKFYVEMYTTGVVSEQTYNKHFIPQDQDMNGVTVTRDFTISQKNRQRAKILSSTIQVQERKEIIYQKQLTQYHKLVQLYDSETKDYVNNRRCENKLMDIVQQYKNQSLHLSLVDIPANPLPSDLNNSFIDTCSGLTAKLLLANKSVILLCEAKAFFR